MPTAPAKGRRADKLRQMIEDIRIAMLTTRDGGALRGRPMECVQVEPPGTLWFFTGASSPKAGEVDDEHEVSLAFIDKAEQNYVSVSGRAVVVRDRAKARELWTEEQRVWYPDGLDDPDLALLKVAVQQAEYWDRPTNDMVASHGLVRAIADEAPDLGENEKLSFERSS
jgi:general stress protein 26